MFSIKSFITRSISFSFALIFLAACASTSNKIRAPEETHLKPTGQTAPQDTLTPSLLADYLLGTIDDMAWSPSSKTFATNYWMGGKDPYNFVEVFSTESLKNIWIAENSVASDLVFTSDGKFIVESNTHVPLFYWRSIERGNVVHMGELTNIDEVKHIDCNGGGQIMIANAKKNIAVIADYLNLIGLNSQDMVIIRELDLTSGKCKELLTYHGSFDLFDMNSNGSQIVYGDVGKDDSLIIWNMEKQSEVCHYPGVEFGRFVPGENTLAVIRDQKTIFIDAATCQEKRELPVSTIGTNLAFSSDGQWMAIAKDDVEIIETTSGRILAQIPFPKNAAMYDNKLFSGGIEFSPDDRYLLLAFSTGAYTGEIQLWQLNR